MPGAGTQIIADLEKAKGQYMAGGVVHDQPAVDAITGIQDVVKKHGADISPTSLRKVRQIYERAVAEAGGFDGKDLTTRAALNAKEEASNSIRGILNSSPTDIGALNKEISFWLDLQKVTTDSALNDIGQKGGLLRAAVAPAIMTASFLGGLEVGGVSRGAEAATVATLGNLGYEVSRTAIWRTFSGVQKARIADALASGSVRNTVLAIGRSTMAAIEASSDWKARQKAMGLQAPSPGRDVTVTGPIPNSNAAGSTALPTPGTPPSAQ